VKRKTVKPPDLPPEQKLHDRKPELLMARLAELDGTDLEVPKGVALGIQAVYDRLLVWQFPPALQGKSTYGDGPILKSETTKTRIHQSIPRGIIVSAGLGALDALRANGIDIGHVVYFAVNSMYRLPLDDHDGQHLALLRAGDVVGSEDLARALDCGECHIVEKDGEHLLVDKDGKQWKPRLPWIEE
jgi:hypothetical protein